ncbi:hypothetical protein F5B20DRAFT_531394 [Whalleya microplaca]|nr:hypothetical protein F5B20DRAFT_531394 [Whalleya microplaca]
MGTWLSRSRQPEDPWLRPELRTKNYDAFGDAYRDYKYKELAANWAVDSGNKPYLTYVKQVSENGWTHLRLLADFMSIGTVPQRWKDLDPRVPKLKPEERGQRISKRESRVERTEVCVLDYYVDRAESTLITSATELGKALDQEVTDSKIQFKLYVVEDLSRDVIETLGQKLKIQPDVFRAHIADFAWYNVLDRWRDPPQLDILQRRQNWMQLRYVTVRYFDTEKEFSEAVSEANEFNVLRRPDDDLSNKAWWDKQGAVVGLTRSRATFWQQTKNLQSDPPIGVLLLDPTVKKGLPLWRGRRTYHPVPEFGSKERWPEPHKPDNFYKDFQYWAKERDMFSTSNSDTTSIAHIPIQTLLRLVCSEWLTMSDYIKTRLNQVDLEIVKPEAFAPGSHVDNALQKLHMWRRFIPLYREMVSETLQHVFRFPCHSESFSETAKDIGSVGGSTILHQEPGTTRNSADSWATPRTGDQLTDPSRPVGSYRKDFLLVLSQLEEYQKRIDRLTSVVTAVMSIEDSRRGLTDNHNIGRLTGLATFFIPFSLIAGILSMQSDIDGISSKTFRVYFAVSLPLAVVVALVAWVLSQPEIKRYLTIFKRTSDKRTL